VHGEPEEEFPAHLYPAPYFAVEESPREFDAIVETSEPSSNVEWSCLDVKDVVRITRWTDTKLGNKQKIAVFQSQNHERGVQ
jgi:hypothetical protein